MSIEKYKLHKVNQLPVTLENNSIYYVSPASGSMFETFITDKSGGIRSGSIDKTELMGVVVHGVVSGSARPTGYGVVTWIGSVEPINAINNDIWHTT
jgi:hypothetical protein